MSSLNSLQHNGVLIPPKYVAKGLSVKIRGKAIQLTAEQEELAVAWTKKIGTPYVEDEVFVYNFHEDFSEKLGIQVKVEDVDYGDILKTVIADREAKAALNIEEKKRQASERKAIREENKEKYGHAIIDGKRVELGNYMVEPSSIFMGRGRHPWRGRWKDGPSYEDIELNLSPDAPRPPGNWKAIVWEQNDMWIARWRDRLGARMKQKNGEQPIGKIKYVWPSDASFLKQGKDIEKYDKARELKLRLNEIKEHIDNNLDSLDLRRRKIATVSYLIDHLKFRVGDEKDEDEADTVGASTLRPEHLYFNNAGTVTFDFLGKDSVRMTITEKLDPRVVRNLRDFAKTNGEPLFDGVNSAQVGDFLKEVMEGLSAKVFRTCYATSAVENKLEEFPIKREAPDYMKRHIATKANLEAAMICNHKRTIPKTWEQGLEKKRDLLKKLLVKERSDETKFRAKLRSDEEKYRVKLNYIERELQNAQVKQNELKRNLNNNNKTDKYSKKLEKQITASKKKTKALRERSRKLKNDHIIASNKLRKQLEERIQRNHDLTERIRLQVEAQEITRDFNLGTSLKNYVDPRIYYYWGQKVGFDWKHYYPATLQKKFSWLEQEDNEE